jgi:hypothetical protein
LLSLTMKYTNISLTTDSWFSNTSVRHSNEPEMRYQIPCWSYNTLPVQSEQLLHVGTVECIWKCCWIIWCLWTSFTAYFLFFMSVEVLTHFSSHKNFMVQ